MMIQTFAEINRFLIQLSDILFNIKIYLTIFIRRKCD